MVEKSEVKIAYIMQCHKNPQQINRLISKLQSDTVDFYVHVDRKSEIQPLIEKYGNLVFVPEDDRVNVRWGDYSQCEATLALMSCVISSGKSYDFVWLISGQDYPIKSLGRIDAFLQERKNCTFINFTPENWVNYPRWKKRNELYHFPWMIGTGTATKILRRLWYFITGGRGYTLRIFKRKSPFVKEYFGSSWWCMPYDCMREVFSLSQRPEVRAYFSHSINPDESIFQTQYMHAECHHSKRIHDYLTYVDWSAGRSNPKILTKADERALLCDQNDFLIARKFDMDVDTDILDSIDEAIGK